MSGAPAREGARLAGQLLTPLPPPELAAALRGVGTSQAEARESSHYTGGVYVSLPVDDEVFFALEHIEHAEYLAVADADEAGPLRAVASRISAALARLGIRHRFELYDAGDELMAYLHHAWPWDPAHGPEP
jgi:hypothetical protein